jgi:1-acyl-sn-glycerol-3-phosphate acyltransferase
MPVVPVAHVAGLYWPRRKFMRYPGTIKARFLPAIPPGLGKQEFMRRLVAETETVVDELLIDAAHGPESPALPESARRRLAELGHPVAEDRP